MIKFHTKVSRIANLYFFVANLSNWHKSCRKSYNEEWLKNNPLTEQEKELLTNFSAIHSKYSFGKESFYLGYAFFLNDDPWKEIKEKTDCEIELRQIFSVFEPRFEKIWQSDEKKLLEHQSYINKYFEKNQDTVEKIEKDLSSFFCLNKAKVNEAEIVLLLSSKDFIAGGANIKPFGVTLELSNWTKDNNKILTVLFHELTHLAFENYVMLTQVSLPIDSRIRESIVAGLFPNGYLSEKYFGLTNSNNNGAIVRDYFLKSKHLDNDFILDIKKRLAQTD